AYSLSPEDVGRALQLCGLLDPATDPWVDIQIGNSAAGLTTLRSLRREDETGAEDEAGSGVDDGARAAAEATCAATADGSSDSDTLAAAGVAAAEGMAAASQVQSDSVKKEEEAPTLWLPCPVALLTRGSRVLQDIRVVSFDGASDGSLHGSSLQSTQPPPVHASASTSAAASADVTARSDASLAMAMLLGTDVHAASTAAAVEAAAGISSGGGGGGGCVVRLLEVTGPLPQTPGGLLLLECRRTPGGGAAADASSVQATATATAVTNAPVPLLVLSDTNEGAFHELLRLRRHMAAALLGARAGDGTADLGRGQEGADGAAAAVSAGSASAVTVAVTAAAEEREAETQAKAAAHVEMACQQFLVDLGALLDATAAATATPAAEAEVAAAEEEEEEESPSAYRPRAVAGCDAGGGARAVVEEDDSGGGGSGLCRFEASMQSLLRHNVQSQSQFQSLQGPADLDDSSSYAEYLLDVACTLVAGCCVAAGGSMLMQTARLVLRCACRDLALATPEVLLTEAGADPRVTAELLADFEPPTSTGGLNGRSLGGGVGGPPQDDASGDVRLGLDVELKGTQSRSMPAPSPPPAPLLPSSSAGNQLWRQCWWGLSHQQQHQQQQCLHRAASYARAPYVFFSSLFAALRFADPEEEAEYWRFMAGRARGILWSYFLCVTLITAVSCSRAALEDGPAAALSLLLFSGGQAVVMGGYCLLLAACDRRRAGAVSSSVASQRRQAAPGGQQQERQQQPQRCPDSGSNRYQHLEGHMQANPPLIPASPDGPGSATCSCSSTTPRRQSDDGGGGTAPSSSSSSPSSSPSRPHPRPFRSVCSEVTALVAACAAAKGVRVAAVALMGCGVLRVPALMGPMALRGVEVVAEALLRPVVERVPFPVFVLLLLLELPAVLLLYRHYCSIFPAFWLRNHPALRTLVYGALATAVHLSTELFWRREFRRLARSRSGGGRDGGRGLLCGCDADGCGGCCGCGSVGGLGCSLPPACMAGNSAGDAAGKEAEGGGGGFGGSEGPEGHDQCCCGGFTEGGSGEKGGGRGTRDDSVAGAPGPSSKKED
ncbi:hypothetical protein Agub_g2914, partial [Astrephomene gubernaculifera]